MRKSTPQEEFARIIYPKQETVFEIHTSYNEEFVNKLKLAVPPARRKFIWDEKIWVVDIKYLGKVKSLIRGHYGCDLEEYNSSTDEIPKRPERQQTPRREENQKPQTWDAATILIQTAPPEALKELYHKCVRANHPDIGGSAEVMSSLNRAWEEIKQVRGIN